MPPALEAIMVLLGGLILGRWFAHVGFRRAIPPAGALVIAVAVFSLLVLWATHVWWAWVVAVVQISCALAFAAIAPERRRYDVFISYRRTESGQALWIRAELERRNFSVYLDLAELTGGCDFRPELKNPIAQAPVTVVLLAPQSIDRCWLEDDVMTQEIVHASELRKRIVPILINGAARNKFPLESPPPSESTKPNCRHKLPSAIVLLKEYDCIEHIVRQPEATIVQLVKALHAACAK